MLSLRARVTSRLKYGQFSSEPKEERGVLLNSTFCFTRRYPKDHFSMASVYRTQIGQTICDTKTIPNTCSSLSMVRRYFWISPSLGLSRETAVIRIWGPIEAWPVTAGWKGHLCCPWGELGWGLGEWEMGERGFAIFIAVTRGEGQSFFHVSSGNLWGFYWVYKYLQIDPKVR